MQVSNQHQHSESQNNRELQLVNIKHVKALIFQDTPIIPSWKNMPTSSTI